MRPLWIVNGLVLSALLVASSALAGDLTAGDVDDNLNFDDYLEYQREAAEGTGLPPLTLADRVTLLLVDTAGQPLRNAHLEIRAEGSPEPFLETEAGTDGVLRVFPEYDGAGDAPRLLVTVPGYVPEEVAVDLDSLPADRTVALSLSGRSTPLPDALDILFVVDTTGSMSDELSYLTVEFRSIIADVQSDHPSIAMRFGLIVYRDVGDDYVTRSLGFTTSLTEMQSWLAAQRASGGGDYPEAVDQALSAALQAAWRDGPTVRMLFHVADAPSHKQRYAATMDALGALRKAGIHVYPLAASGVASEAEYLMRASALLTQGRYLFLTDDSGVGAPHAEPSTKCYLVTALDGLLARVVASELSGTRVEPALEEILRTVGDYNRGVCISGEPMGGGGVPSASGGDDFTYEEGSTGDVAKSSEDIGVGVETWLPPPEPPASPGATTYGSARDSPAPATASAGVSIAFPAVIVAVITVAMAAMAWLLRSKRQGAP